MTVFLDTCAFARYSGLAAGAMGAKALKWMKSPSTEILYSSAMLLELEYLRMKARLVFAGDAAALVERLAVVEHWIEAPFDSAAVRCSATLLQRGILDPFDNMIAAGAIAKNATLLTCDRRLSAVPELKTEW